MLKKLLRFLLILGFVCQIIMAQDFKLDPQSSMAVPTYLGKVLLLKGKALKINPEKKESILRLNEKIYPGDTVSTQKNTVLKIKMNMVDDSSFTLGPKSKFTFVSSKYNKKRERQTVYRFLRGKIRAKFPQKSKPGANKMELGKKVSLGIRGTEFYANVRNNTVKEEIVEVGLTEGLLDILNRPLEKITKLNPKEHFISVENLANNKFIENTNILSPQSINSLNIGGNSEYFLKYFKSVKELKNSEKKPTNIIQSKRHYTILLLLFVVL